MASSFSKRASQFGHKANVPLTLSNTDEILFVCYQSREEDKAPRLKVPSDSAQKHSKYVPGTIGLHLRNGEVWLAHYNKQTQSVENLENLMQYFDVKPYSLFLFQYYGGTEFGVEIFNENAVEIDYSPKSNELNALGEEQRSMDELQKKKLKTTFKYNARSKTYQKAEVVIKESDLSPNDSYRVLTSEECCNLGISGSMKVLDIGFKKLRWQIGLKWTGDGVIFDQQWFHFVITSKLNIGDVCIFRKRKQEEKYEIIILAVPEWKKANRSDLSDGVGLVKWFKIMNLETIRKGTLELPRLFAEEFGGFMEEDVNLILRDGMQYAVKFCKSSNQLSGLVQLLQKYSVWENFLIFFEYLGKSTFFISIYDRLGQEIFNDLNPKLLLKTVVSHYGTPATVVLESSDKDTIGDIHPSLPSISESIKSFTVVMLKSHVDQQGHGLYLPRYLIQFYRNWKKGTVVTLCVGSNKWNIALHRTGQTCRFGLGWNSFTRENNLQIGQKVQFTYLGDGQFEAKILAD